MEIQRDTYFLDSSEALKIALLNNKFYINNRVESTQICYYDGPKLNDAPYNCINVPRGEIISFFSKTKYRFPRSLSVGKNLSPSQAKQMTVLFQDLINLAMHEHKINIKKAQDKITTLKLDFSENLRIFVPTCRQTTVMRYVSQNIAKSFKKLGYNVLYYIQSDIESCSMLPALQAQYDFNPHVIVDINNFNNYFFNDDVFNFMWFQDAMPILTNEQNITLRERDFIFSYQTLFTNLLINKGVDKNKIFVQDLIPVDIDEFFLDTNITKENKIIFVGSYYEKEKYAEFMNHDINNKLISTIEKGIVLSSKLIVEIFNSCDVDISGNDVYINTIMQGYNRNTVVSWLCDNQNEKIEVYGYGWNLSDNENIHDKFKGSVSKKELNNLYNESKYVLSVSGQVINTQRLGEIVHTGAIPIVYDSREITHENETWDKECLYFKTKDELNYILDNNIEPKKYRTKKMLDHFTYKEFTDKIISTIKDNS